MSRALKLRKDVPILTLSGAPTRTPPLIAAGKAAAIAAENARSPQRARAAGSPQPAAFPRRSRIERHEFVQNSDVAVEVAPERARLPPKIARKSHGW